MTRPGACAKRQRVRSRGPSPPQGASRPTNRGAGPRLSRSHRDAFMSKELARTTSRPPRCRCRDRGGRISAAGALSRVPDGLGNSATPSLALPRQGLRDNPRVSMGRGGLRSSSSAWSRSSPRVPPSRRPRQPGRCRPQADRHATLSAAPPFGDTRVACPQHDGPASASI